MLILNKFHTLNVDNNTNDAFAFRYNTRDANYSQIGPFALVLTNPWDHTKLKILV